MKRNISESFFGKLKSNMILAVSGGMLLVSCGAQMGGYSETDGVYYDPGRDTLPQGTVMERGNRVGEDYNYQDSAYVDNDDRYLRDRKYRDWDRTKRHTSDSDWGTYAGTDVTYNSWYSPYVYNFYPSFGWNSYFGMGYGYGMGYGLGYYSPLYSMYDPFWNYSMFGYSPYFSYGYGGYYGYSPYYGYGGYYDPYYSGYYGAPMRYRRSASSPGFRSDSNTRRMASQPEYRSSSQPTFRSENSSASSQRSTYPQQNGERRVFRNSAPQETERVYQERPVYRENNTYNRSNDGFRTGGFGSGSTSSSSSGGFGGGSGRSSGGFRTGGR